MNKMVSVRRAVLEATEDIGHREFDTIVLQRWATYAEKAIASKYQYRIARKVLELRNGQYATLPCETFDVLSVFLGDVGADYSHIWSFDPSYTISTWEQGIGITVITGSAYTNSGVSEYSVVNNEIEFKKTISGYTEVTVYGMFYQTDKDGFIMVAEEHLEAIAQYIKLKIAERSRFGSNKMDFADVQYHRREWGKAKSVARSRTAKLTQAELSSLSELLNNPLTGKVFDYGRLQQYV